MTHLWPISDPIQVQVGAEGLPQRFWWRGAWRQVSGVANRWRVRATWWSEDTWREYFKLTTTDGLLCTLYQDLSSGAWFCAELYD